MFGAQYGANPQAYPGAYPDPYTARLAALQQPQMFQPQNNTQPGLIRVTGLEGAKAYQMGPNGSVALFDANDDVFFVKSTDGAGFPTIRAFRFSPMESAPAPQGGEFVTRAEFEQLKGMILNGQQFIREQPQPAGTGTNVGTNQPSGNGTAVPAVPAADGRP